MNIRAIIIRWTLVAALALLTACSSDNSSAPTASGASSSVHASGWDMSHAASARTSTTGCTTCHGADYRGIGAIPGCYDCHFGPSGSRVPANATWVHGSIPHNEYLIYGTVCDACHQITRAAGKGPTACHDCHVGLTHPLGQVWLDPNSAEFHGIEATTALDTCRNCHGNDLTGGTAGVSCYTCHFDPAGSRVPAGQTWLHGTTPHDFLSASQAVCNRCHTLDRSYGNGPAACHDCHVTASHVLGQPWLDSKVAGYHGNVAAVDSTPCQQCHGSDYAGGGSGVSCYTCHFGPTGSKVPTGETWLHGDSHTFLASYESVCNGCHTVSRTYSNGPGVCHDCHALHTFGAAWLVPTAHGSQSITERAECLSCHDMATGGTSSGRACRTCHTLADPPLTTGQCTSCHGRPPNGAAFPNRNRNHNRHSGASCATCHSGAGTGSLLHWYPDETAPADVVFSVGGMTYSAGSCTGICHIGTGSDKDHNNETW